MKWNNAKPQVKIETFEVENDSDHHKNINVPCSACLNFHELIQSNNRLLNEKHYLEPEKWKRKEQDRRYSIGRGHKTLVMVLI